MIDIIMFLAFFFMATFLLGKLFEKIRIPWLFSALILGFGCSLFGLFFEIQFSPTFIFLSELGMYFLLFIIGFELDISKIFSHDKFIIKNAFAVILAETAVGTLIMYFCFQLSLPLSILVATSFATVGEAVLLPILDEFKLTNTRIGRTILGIGILDDIVELFVVLAAVMLVSFSAGHTHFNVVGVVIVFCLSILLVYLLVRVHKRLHVFKFKDIPSFFLLVLFFIFLFVGLGKFVEAGSLGAILAGIALKNLLTKENIRYIDAEIRTMAYGFLAPIFFLWVGMSTDFSYLKESFHLVILIVLLTGGAKIIALYFAGKKYLGSKKAILVGVGLTVKLSTSIVVLRILLDEKLISLNIYSVLIASSVVFTVLVPMVLPLLIKRWNILFSR